MLKLTTTPHSPTQKRRAFLFVCTRRQTDKTLTKNNRQNILQCRKYFRYLCADKKT